MKLILLALISLLSMQSHASIATMSALGQSENGSYYLMDARNMFFNPTYISGKYINFESVGQAVWVEDNMGIAAGTVLGNKKLLQVFHMPFDFMALSPYLNVENGKSIDTYGLNIGFNFETFMMAAGFDMVSDDFLPKVNAQYGWEDMMYFADYAELVKGTSFSFGAAKNFKPLFIAAEYGKDDGVRDLNIMIGGVFKFHEDSMLSILGSAKQHVFFKTETDLSLGAAMDIGSSFNVDVAANLNALGLPEPSYDDFDLKFSITYMY